MRMIRQRIFSIHTDRPAGRVSVHRWKCRAGEDTGKEAVVINIFFTSLLNDFSFLLDYILGAFLNRLKRNHLFLSVHPRSFVCMCKTNMSKFNTK